MEESGKSSHAERLQAVHLQALRLVDQLQALTSEEPPEQLPLLLELIVQVQEVAKYASGGADPVGADEKTPAPTPKQLQEFGKLLRDKRNAAGLSRMQLARRAKISDATIKFLETARHPPSRATLIRLISVEELRLTWSDAPGAHSPPSTERIHVVEGPQFHSELNCLLTPSFDPVRMITELGRFLNGAGGHVEQTSAYLDHQSAAAYLALCQQSAVTAALRASTPLAEAARRIVSNTGQVPLKIIALGSGDATLEVRLVQHLIEEACTPNVELCLVDVSQPLLACGQKHAAEALAGIPQAHLWGMQCHFHELPLYSRLVHGSEKRPRCRRVFCMLGGTFANLDHEPRFFQHALPHCARGDLLLLDLQLARGSAQDPAEIKKRDKQWAAGVTHVEAAWLSGPIWRHCKNVVRVDFHWNLETHCPVPGSYALGAVATVQLHSGAERQFSMFRFRRYAPDQVAECLHDLGWDEIGVMPFGGVHHPSSLRLFCKRTEPSAHE